MPKLETNPDGARPWPAWAYKLIEECGREDIRRAVLLARYTGQRQADVLRMTPEHVEDGGIHVMQQKTGKELWVPLHPDLRVAGDVEQLPVCAQLEGGTLHRRPLQSRVG